MGDGLPGIIGILFYVILILGIWSPIFRKAGYSWARAILMLIPLVNLVVLIMFAAQEWPVLKELRSLKANSGALSEDDGYALLQEARKFENRGDIQAARAKYESIINALPNTAVANDAKIGLQQLKG